MTQDISLFSNFGLATPSSVTFSESLNAFVGAGFRSIAGNTYFNAARFAEGLLIKEDVGNGHMWSFLNGVHIYDLKTHKLLAEKVFPQYQGLFYSLDAVKRIVKNLLIDLIVAAAEEQGCDVDANEVSGKISTMLNRSFSNNQMLELEKNVKALGF